MRIAVLCLFAVASCKSAGHKEGANTGPSQVAPAAEKAETPANAEPKAPRTGPGKIGTAHPFVLEDASFGFGWVIGCQARADTNGDGKIEIHVGNHGDVFGDAFKPFLFTEDGEGEAIEAYVGTDASRRFVGFIRDGNLELFDGKEGTRINLTDLGIDSKDDGNPTLHHPALSFGPKGRVAGIKRTDKGADVVLIDPATGQVTVVFSGSENLWRVDFNEAGTELSVWEVSKDTDNNGKLEPPMARTSLSARGCRGPIMSYGVYGWNGDQPVETKVKLDPVPALGDAETMDSPPRDVKNALIRSSKGATLVGSKKSGAFIVGPIEWVRD